MTMTKLSLLQRLDALARPCVNLLNSLQSVAALLARLYVAQVFFLSGLTKVRDWDTTLALFMDEYKVPLLPPALAAVNAVAVVSLTEIAPAALQQHVFWGSLLVGIVVFGPGRVALDHWLQAYTRHSNAHG